MASGRLQPFDLILLIVLGGSIQQGLTQDDYSVTGAAIVVGTISVLQVATSYMSFRVLLLRPSSTGSRSPWSRTASPSTKTFAASA